MRTFIFIFLLVASCVVGSIAEGIKPIQVQSIAQIEFRPVGGTTNTITNVVALKLIGDWMNEALNSPISSFTLKSYPKPVHSVAIIFKSGDMRTMLISGGSILSRTKQSTPPRLVERLTVVSVQGQQFLVKSCPELLLYPRTNKFVTTP